MLSQYKKRNDIVKLQNRSIYKEISSWYFFIAYKKDLFFQKREQLYNLHIL